MDISNRRKLKRDAQRALDAASYSPGKLMLIHTGVSASLALLLAVLNHLLELQIDDTAGLSGVGLRTVLQTAQSVLSLVQLALMVFWQIGFTYAALRISSGKSAEPQTLLEGFHRFGPVLRLRLLTLLLCGGVLFACVYLSSTLVSLTPWAQPLVDAYEIGTEEALMAAMEEVALPMAGIFCVVAAVLFIPYYYRLRMVDFSLMDQPEMGAMVAVRKSRVITFRKRLQLFRLDLSFWWFYLLEALILVVAYGDVLLPLVGITLPWSETVSYYVFLILCYAGQLLLYWWKGSLLQVTYAKAYEALSKREA